MQTIKNKKNRIRSNFPVILLTALLALNACTDPETAQRKQLEEAITLQENGQDHEALIIFQSLLTIRPEDPDLLQRIGEIYQNANDLNLAAFYLEQAALNNPEDAELLHKSYLALEAAGENTLPALRQLASRAPENMAPKLWLKLGYLLALNNETQPALSAYLKGIPQDTAQSSPDTANAIAILFLQLNNTAPAERWFKIAAQDSGPEALTALLGLLEIKLSAAEWSAAEDLIQKLDQRFPGAVDASNWATARGELQKWRKAQQEMTETLKTTDAKITKTSATAASDSRTKTANSSKSISADEFDLMETLANKPAVETAETKTQTIEYNPGIRIQPADPDLGENSASPQPTPIDPLINANKLEPIKPEVLTQTEAPPIDRDQLLTEAENSLMQRNFKSAIRFYWQALGLDSTTPDVWSLLSQAYTLNSETRNAETTALEAVRLAPKEVDYTLKYLRIAQRSKPPQLFLTELKIAFDRFPNNPEIIISLARARQRISKDRLAAAALYQQFITQFPSHPLRPEAETSLKTLTETAP